MVNKDFQKGAINFGGELITGTFLPARIYSKNLIEETY